MDLGTGGGSAEERKRGAKQFCDGLQKIVNNPAFYSFIEELEADAKARTRAEQDPEGYVRQKGIEIPDGWKVSIEQGSWCVVFRWFGWYWRICLPSWP
jgi:hypothetical protein